MQIDWVYINFTFYARMKRTPNVYVIIKASSSGETGNLQVNV